VAVYSALSRSNSFPSGSASTTQPPGELCRRSSMTRAPSASSRASSSAWEPSGARSRWTRFFADLASRKPGKTPSADPASQWQQTSIWPGGLASWRAGCCASHHPAVATGQSVHYLLRYGDVGRCQDRAVARVTGDEVRSAIFPLVLYGYSPLEVDAWLHRIGDLIDVGGPGSSDYPREKFMKVMRGYDTRAVDRFVSALFDGGVTTDLLAYPSLFPVFMRSREAQPALLAIASAAAWRYRIGRDKPSRERYRLECAAEWAAFPDLPGTRLRMTRHEIVDRDGRALMTRHRARLTEAADGRVFRTASTRTGRRVVDDLTGELIISRSGRHKSHQAETTVSRGDHPWLWFPVQGTSSKDAVMHAVDVTSTKILSFRRLARHDTEIVAGPGFPVTPEILCVIVVASELLESFFIVTGP
jgi:DivIVA domain-containing protein